MLRYLLNISYPIFAVNLNVEPSFPMFNIFSQNLVVGDATPSVTSGSQGSQENSTTGNTLYSHLIMIYTVFTYIIYVVCRQSEFW